MQVNYVKFIHNSTITHPKKWDIKKYTRGWVLWHNDNKKEVNVASLVAEIFAKIEHYFKSLQKCTEIKRINKPMFTHGPKN